MKEDKCHTTYLTNRTICKDNRGSWIVPLGITFVLLIFLIWSFFVDTNIERKFDADYLVFDAIFLLSFCVALLLKKKMLPLAIGAIFGFLIFIIDGVIWWYTGVRYIDAPFSKWWVDFMMDISYGIVAFSWMIIALRRDKDAIWWTIFLFGGWMLVAGLSQWITLDDTTITTAREMGSLHFIGIIAAMVGYWILYYLRYDNEIIIYVFFVACLQGFIMEFYLWIFQIRPSGFDVVVFDTFVLINQGMPYMVILLDIFVPWSLKNFKKMHADFAE